MIEGELTDTADLDIKAIQSIQGGEITLELANGKVFILIDAHWAGDGNVGSEEANLLLNLKELIQKNLHFRSIK